MTIEEIKELLEIFNESGVAELELQRGENRLRLRRAGTTQEFVVGAGPVAAGAPIAPVPSGPQSVPTPHLAQAPRQTFGNAPAGPSTASSVNQAPDADSGPMLVRSPIVGTYYEAPAPDAPPFVRVGDSVEPGQVLCIIESMKLMNEIEAEVAGVIASKLVENGRPVEYGEALFAISPR